MSAPKKRSRGGRGAVNRRLTGVNQEVGHPGRQLGAGGGPQLQGLGAEERWPVATTSSLFIKSCTSKHRSFTGRFTGGLPLHYKKRENPHRSLISSTVKRGQPDSWGLAQRGH